MSDQTPPRQMFPESRLMLGMLSPVLGVFFAGCIYFTSVWQPSTIGDRIAKFAVEDILFTFITLCGVGFIASIHQETFGSPRVSEGRHAKTREPVSQSIRVPVANL